MPEPTTSETPRDILEAAEIIPEPSHEELAFALGRLLVWMLEGRRLTSMGERLLVVTYKLRPDLIEGATLDDIAKRRGMRRSWVNKLSMQFTHTFGVRGLNGHAPAHTPARAPGEPSRARAHGVAASHLKLVNRFCEWKAFHDKKGGAMPRDPHARALMRRDFEPIARFIAELEGS